MMNGILLEMSRWLWDYYLHVTGLLAITLLVTLLVGQPARRMALHWSMSAALVALAMLCTVPGWSIIHLIAATPEPALVSEPVAELPPRSSIEQVPGEIVPTYDMTPLVAPSIDPFVAEEKVLEAESAAIEFDYGLLSLYVTAAGSVLTLLWQALGHWQLNRLRLSAVAAPVELKAALDALVVSGSDAPKLSVSDKLQVAVAVGLRRPQIILPETLVQTSSASSIRTILAHELAHVQHRDLWLLALLRVLMLLLWAHPLYWLWRRGVRLDQETLADAAAADLSSRDRYAEQLVNWARSAATTGTPHVAASVGLWESPSQLKRRLTVLLDDKLILLRRCSRQWRIGATLLIAGLAVALSLVTLQPTAETIAEENTDALTEVDTNRADSKEESEGLVYSGIVVDKRSNEPIANAKVLVRIKTSSIHPLTTLDEATYVTNAKGRYSFRITSEQLADRYLYIEVEATHPTHARKIATGYGLTMIRKNEKLDEKPFFSRLELQPAEQVFGVLLKPNGEPASGVKVSGYSKEKPRDMEEYGSFSSTVTDEQGRFRLNMVAGGHSIVWFLPRNFAPETHVLKDRKGDLGQFALSEGVRLTGQVRNVGGKPLTNVWVNAVLRSGPAKKPILLPVADLIKRSTLTDAAGRFQIGPLPPGTYQVMPAEQPSDSTLKDRPLRPVDATFLPMKVKIDGRQPQLDLDIQAVASVTLRARTVTSDGKPTRGHGFSVVSYSAEDGERQFYKEATPNAEGRAEMRVPKGLARAFLNCMTNEHGALRIRLTSDSPLVANQEYFELGKLDRDYDQIEIVRYEAPILLVEAVDGKGRQIKEMAPSFIYENEQLRKELESTNVNAGMESDVSAERQDNGRWRSSQLLPDEPFVLRVNAEGYQESVQELELAEGETCEIRVILKRNGNSTGRVNTEGRNDDGTSRSEREREQFGISRGEANPSTEADLDVIAVGESQNQPDSTVTQSIDGLIAGTLGASSDEGTLMAASADEDEVVAFQATGEVKEAVADAQAEKAEVQVATTVVLSGPTDAWSLGGSGKPFYFDQQSRQSNTVQGTCIDVDGQAAKGVKVTVYRSTPGRGPKLIRSVTSDTQGKFDIPAILPENELASAENSQSGYLPGAAPYLITFQKKGAISRSFSGFPDMIARGIKCTLKLEHSATLTGRVTNASGESVAGAVVSANRQAQLPTILGFLSARTDSEGRYEITDAIPFDRESHEKAKLNAGQQDVYWLAGEPMHSANPAMTLDPLLKVTHPDYATKKVHYSAIPGQQDVQLDSAAVIKGRVLGLDGKPQSGLRVHAMSSKPFEAGLKVAPDDAHMAYAETDDAGEYQFTSLPAGRYEVKIGNPEHSKAMPAWVSEGISGFDSKIGAENRVPDMKLQEGGILRLKLTDSRSEEPIEFDAGDVAQVYIHYPELHQFHSHRSIQADCGLGEFISLRVLPGNMEIRVFHAGSPYDNQGNQPEWGHSRHEPETKEIEVALGETATLEYALSNRKAFVVAQSAAFKALQALDDEDALAHALEALNKVIAESTSDDIEMETVHNTRAQVLERMGRHAEAMAAFEAMAKRETPNRAMYQQRLAVYLTNCPDESLRDYSRAVELWEEVVGTFPETVEGAKLRIFALEAMAKLYQKLGKRQENQRVMDELMTLLNKMAESTPGSDESLTGRHKRADIYAKVGAYQKAIEEYESLLLEMKSGEVFVHRIRHAIAANNLAHLFATCPEDDLRDGKRAVELAEQAAELFGKPQADMLDTLAAAYAETGDFNKAIATQENAIKLARPDQREKMRRHLELYLHRKPLRAENAEISDGQ